MFFLVFGIFTPGISVLAQESSGNSTVSSQVNWPAGIGALTKSPAKICSLSGNEDERIYYSGDVETLNKFLKLFAAETIPVHSLIIDTEWNKINRPGGLPDRYDWMLRIPSAAGQTNSSKDKKISADKQYPSIHIALYSDHLNFEFLVIPESLKVTLPSQYPGNNSDFNAINAIIYARQWSKAMAVWIAFADPYIGKIRVEEDDPSRQWVEVKSLLLSKWLSNSRFFIFETNQIMRSSMFALEKTGVIVDVGSGQWSSPGDDKERIYRNAKMTNFLKQNRLQITDPNTAMSAAKLVEELSFTAQILTSLKYNTKNFRKFDRHLYECIFDRKVHWQYTAEKKDNDWIVRQKYVGPPASITMPPVWRLTVDSNNYLIDAADAKLQMFNPGL
jgi:hypothetical protein